MSGLTTLGLTLALLGPGVIALLSKHFTRQHSHVAANALWLAVFTLLIAAVATIALGERLTWSDIGFAETSWWSIPTGCALALFFIFIFGPAAHRALARSALGSFEAGQRPLAALPRWYLSLTIVIVAAGEEWLYRGYAIERLQIVTGSSLLAGALSLVMFGIVHLPMWGLGVSLTTLVSGGIFTALYLWQRDVAFLMLAHVLTDLYGLAIAPKRPTAAK